MKFFVAKVNLKEQSKTNLTYLRPLQFAFESEKFMLPIRLGMLNAKGPQELFVYLLTKNGRVETTNYQTIKLPTDTEIPAYVKNEFSEFYKSMFTNQVNKESMKAVFTEYFWDMSWCDPCAARPLTTEELKELGVYWANGSGQRFNSGAQNAVKVTRLHLRYSKETFPDDLMFQETKDTQNFQGRYIIHHRWTGDRNACESSKNYYKFLPEILDKRAQNLANLTSWNIADIRKKMNYEGLKETSDDKKSSWWKSLWK